MIITKETDHLHIETPLIRSLSLSSKLGSEVLLKLDNTQVSGSFKVRGIGNMCVRALQNNPKAPCFVCVSGGNAGLAACYAGMLLNKPVHVFVPTSTCDFVLQQFQLYPGCQLHVFGEVLDETREQAWEFCEAAGGIFVPPFDHPYIWEGNSTIVDEMVHQLKDGVVPSCIMVAVGGGGLLLGLLEGIKRYPSWKHVAIVAVETKGAHCFNNCVEKNQLIPLKNITSAAKSLGALLPSKVLFERRNECNIISVVVSDDDAEQACRSFMREHRMVVELACGAALSVIYGDCLLSLEKEGKVDLSKGPLIAIVCGGVSVHKFVS